MNGHTTAFSVEKARAAMLDKLNIPHDIVNKAIKKVYDKLDAKETKFFVHQGQVVEKVDVEDTAAQLAASDKILSMAGLYARERDARPPSPIVAVEVDSKTGVIRMVIGGAPQGGADVDNNTPQSVDGSLAISEESVPALSAIVAPPVQQDSEHMTQEEPVQIVKVKRGGLPASVYSALFSDSDG